MLSANDNQIGALHHFKPHDPAALRKRRILVVEDEALIAMLIEDFLRDEGAEIVGVVGSVAEALHLIDLVTDEGGLDAAVLDINLDGKPVTPVADRLAALGVPFLFVTGYSEDYVRDRHAAATVIRKPFAADKLMAAVGHLTSPRTSGSSVPWL